jgi:hypothetical protein
MTAVIFLFIASGFRMKQILVAVHGERKPSRSFESFESFAALTTL